jgi:hypothetical protein
LESVVRCIARGIVLDDSAEDVRGWRGLVGTSCVEAIRGDACAWNIGWLVLITRDVELAGEAANVGDPETPCLTELLLQGEVVLLYIWSTSVGGYAAEGATRVEGRILKIDDVGERVAVWSVGRDEIRRIADGVIEDEGLLFRVGGKADRARGVEDSVAAAE